MGRGGQQLADQTVKPRRSSVAQRGGVISQSELTDFWQGASEPLLAWHGTSPVNEANILNNGFDPSQSNSPFCQGTWFSLRINTVDSQGDPAFLPYNKYLRVALSLKNPLKTSSLGFRGLDKSIARTGLPDPDAFPPFHQAAKALLKQHYPGFPEQKQVNYGQAVAEAAKRQGHDAIILYGEPTEAALVCLLNPDAAKVISKQNIFKPGDWRDYQLEQTLGMTLPSIEIRSKAQQKIALKKGLRGRRHLLEEWHAENAYRNLGVAVPPSIIQKGDDPGEIVKVADFIDGRILGQTDWDGRLQAVQAICQDFAADALLSNWDVFSGAGDNIIVDAEQRPVRVDCGGALRNRAQGGSKEMNPKPLELWTLRDAQRNPSAHLFSNMQWEDVENSIKKIMPYQQTLLVNAPEEIAETLQTRLEWMQAILDKSAELRKAGKTNPEIDLLVKDWLSGQ